MIDLPDRLSKVRAEHDRAAAGEAAAILDLAQLDILRLDLEGAAKHLAEYQALVATISAATNDSRYAELADDLSWYQRKLKDAP